MHHGLAWAHRDPHQIRRYRVRLTPSPCACARCSVGVRRALAVRRMVVPNVARPPSAPQLPASSRDRVGCRIRADARHPWYHPRRFRSSEAIWEPGSCAIHRLRGDPGPATACSRIASDRNELPLGPLTGRVRGRLVGGFGCAVWRWAGRCRRRRPSRVPSGRAFGTGRRVRPGG